MCRNCEESSKIMFCEACDKAYHANCLRPVLTSIPKIGWKCKVRVPQRDHPYSQSVVFPLPINACKFGLYSHVEYAVIAAHVFLVLVFHPVGIVIIPFVIRVTSNGTKVSRVRFAIEPIARVYLKRWLSVHRVKSNVYFCVLS